MAEDKTRVTIELPKEAAELLLRHLRSGTWPVESSSMGTIVPQVSVRDEGDHHLAVVEQAHRLWTEFWAGTCPQSTAMGLMEKGLSRVNLWALNFFRFCASVCCGAKSAQVAFFRLSGFRSVLLEGSPASWLWRSGEDWRILLDYELIQETVPEDSRRRVLSELILHETGHMVLHSRVLKPALESSDGFLSDSTPAQKEEAWWFALAIVGLETGRLARAMRDRGSHDATWAYPL